MKMFVPEAPLGTPENPEVLGADSPPSPRGPSKARLLLSILFSMISVSIPALFCLWVSFGLLRAGAIWAWLLLIVTAPVTLAFVLLWMVMWVVLGLTLLATLTGRARIQMGFRRSVDVNRPRPRDVTPDWSKTERLNPFES